MNFSLIPILNVTHVYIYPKPISMKLGENKLIEICTKEMGLNPREGYVFLFFNRTQDKIKLFFLENNSSQELIKVLPKGGFLLPIAQLDQKYIKIDSSKLPSLFRS